MPYSHDLMNQKPPYRNRLLEAQLCPAIQASKEKYFTKIYLAQV